MFFYAPEVENITFLSRAMFENIEIEIVNLKVYLCTKGIIQGICLKTVLSQMNMNLITGSSPDSRGF